MSKHTPGPWRDFGGAIGVLNERGTFCVVIPFSSRPTNGADIRLIAAAPDMLAALHRASMALHFAAELGMPSMMDDHAAVMAAIAKATGRAA